MNRTLTTLLLALCLCLAPTLAVVAQDSVMPIRITEDVVYGHKMGMALSFDVLQPAVANGAGILYMVSGGWFSRHYPAERAAQQFSSLLQAGFTVFTVRHGSAPLFKVPEAVADVKRATRYIHLHASDFGIDPNRLGVTGGSAGGHLSLMLGLAAESEAAGLAAVVAYFPPVDLRRLAGPSERFPALDFDVGLAASISPILFVSSDDPPTLLIHGDADELVSLANSERIYTALQDAGVLSELIVIPGGDHGFTEPEHRARAGVAMLRWFDQYLGAGAPGSHE